jgi:hypothetical protein
MVAFVVLAVTGDSPAAAGIFWYVDDFETNKGMYDSWRHSPFVDQVPPIFLWGLLHYEPMLGRGLGFYRGFEVDAWAYLAYAAVPPGMRTTGGSVEFYLSPHSYRPAGIEVWGSSDGTYWFPLGGGQNPFPSPELISVALPAGAPAKFLELRGEGTIDDLQIAVEYAPEVTTLRIEINRDDWGDVELDPEPNDPNLPQYPGGTAVTLTAVPVEGKAFRHWILCDPNYPGDSNVPPATIDANNPITIVMDSDREVEADFKCGSGVEPMFPLMLGVLGLFVLIRRRL